MSVHSIVLIHRLAAVALLCVGVSVFRAQSAPPAYGDRETLYQVSLINALMAGEFDGIVTVGTLKERGDFGLGTYHGVEGEMVAVDGKYFQVLSTGEVRTPPDTALTPFAAVTMFDADNTVAVAKADSMAALGEAIDGDLPTTNSFYAIRVDGEFDWIKLRSVPTEKPPYPTLPEVTAKQTVWEVEKIRGTLVGLRCPAFAAGLNVAGHHWHFISADGKRGGHVLDLRATRLDAQIDRTPQWEMLLPETPGFEQLDLTRPTDAALRKAEQ